MSETFRLGGDGRVAVAASGLQEQQDLQERGLGAEVWLRENDDGTFPLSLFGTVAAPGPDGGGGAGSVRANVEIALGPESITALKAYFFDH